MGVQLAMACWRWMPLSIYDALQRAEGSGKT
jgi:hypothetical protein